MVRILIVEDDQNKLRKISNALQKLDGVGIDSIEHVVDARSARLRLRATSYDLLILDMAIPSRIDEDIRKLGGLDLLREMLERDIYKVPTHTVGVTAYADIHEEVADQMAQQLLPFVYCDPTSDAWLEKLQAYVLRIIASKLRWSVASDEYHSFLAIVCALESPELNAVRRNGWHWQRSSAQNDATVYYEATIKKDGVARKCYAAAAPRKGMPAAAVLSAKMISTFKPRYLAMTGITSGYVGRTRIGDVIAADPVWDWGSGKLIKRDSETIFEPESHQLDLDVGIRNQLIIIAQDVTTMAQIRQEWAGDAPDHELTLHLGPLASGSAVLADKDTHTRILQQHRGLLGVDMETYAVFCSAQEAPVPRPTVFALKSVVDFADGNKDDRYQRYGAYTSAEVLKRFVEQYL